MTGEGKKKKAKAQNCASVCVCASPVPKGSLLHARILECRGPAADKQTLANKAMLVRWMHSLMNCVYLRCDITLLFSLFFDSMGAFMIDPKTCLHR